MNNSFVSFDYKILPSWQCKINPCKWDEVIYIFSIVVNLELIFTLFKFLIEFERRKMISFTYFLHGNIILKSRLFKSSADTSERNGNCFSIYFYSEIYDVIQKLIIQTFVICYFITRDSIYFILCSSYN